MVPCQLGGVYISWFRNWATLINIENMKCLVSWKKHTEQRKTLLVQQQSKSKNTEKVFHTDTLLDLRNSCVPAGPAQVGTEYRNGQLYSFKYNQQEAKLYNILYYCQCSACFEAVSQPIMSSKTVHTASGMCLAFLLLPLAAAASKLGTYQMLCVYSS